MKLNKKGFTLIELLAVVVILAIILVVTIPNVLDTVDTTKAKAFEDSVEIIQDYAQKQYRLCIMGLSQNASLFNSGTCTFKDISSLITSAGYSADDFDTSNSKIVTSDNKVYLSLISNTNGKFNSSASKRVELDNAANTYAKWLDEQYRIYPITNTGNCSSYANAYYCELVAGKSSTWWLISHIVRYQNAKMIKDATGIEVGGESSASSDIIGIFQKNESGKFCACLFAKESSKYYTEQNYTYYTAADNKTFNVTGSCSLGCTYGSNNIDFDNELGYIK